MDSFFETFLKRRIMKFQEFIDIVEYRLSQRLEGVVQLRRQQVRKNNGLLYEGFLFVDPVFNVSPTIYLEPYFHRHLEGVSLEDVIEDIYALYQENIPQVDFDATSFTDLEKARERIVLKLINRSRNMDLLKEVPFIPFMDLAVVFVCNVSDLMGEYASILIRNEHLALWDISLEELFSMGLSNSPKNQPVIVENMADHINRFQDIEEVFFQEVTLLILSNVYKIHGASVMLYPGILQMIAEEYESDLIILPSSIHEVLLIPKLCLDKRPEEYPDFDAMIREINETEVTDEEILGDHAYLYQRENGKLSFFQENPKNN